MDKKKLNLILHPVRLRILTTLSGREMTAQQVAKVLPDVAVATLYRHMSALQEGDLLRVVSERQIRGTVEKTYAIHEASFLNLSEDDLANATKDDHMRFFSTFVVSLLAEFATYLQSNDDIDFVRDGVGYHTVALHMSDEELGEFSQQLGELLKQYQKPADGRKRRQLSTIFLPTQDQE